MAPKKVSVYTKKEKSKSFILTYWLIDEDTDTDQDLAYMSL